MLSTYALFDISSHGLYSRIAWFHDSSSLATSVIVSSMRVPGEQPLWPSFAAACSAVRPPSTAAVALTSAFAASSLFTALGGLPQQLPAALSDLGNQQQRH